MPNAHPKTKPHQGLLKRVRVSKTGKLKHRSAYHKHLSSHKSGKRLRQLRKDRYAANPEAKRFEKLLFRRLRGRTQPAAALTRSPSPAVGADIKAARREKWGKIVAEYREQRDAQAAEQNTTG